MVSLRMILRNTIGQVAILLSLDCSISLQDITIKNHHLIKLICEMVEVKKVRPSCQFEWCKMVRHLTPEQKIFLTKDKIKILYLAIKRKWRNIFPGHCPDRSTIPRLSEKFNTTGSVANAPRFEHPRTSDTDENKENIAAFFAENLKTLQRRASLQMGVKRSSMQRIMKGCRFRRYQPRRVQALEPGDLKWQDYATWLLGEAVDNMLNSNCFAVMDQIIHSDEATLNSMAL